MESKKDALSVTVLKNRLKQVMDRDVFIIRNKGGLTRAAKEIDEIEGDIARIQVPRFVRSNLEWVRP